MQSNDGNSGTVKGKIYAAITFNIYWDLCSWKVRYFWGFQNMEGKIRLNWEGEISFQKHVKDTLPTLVNITINCIAFY